MLLHLKGISKNILNISILVKCVDILIVDYIVTDEKYRSEYACLIYYYATLKNNYLTIMIYFGTKCSKKNLAIICYLKTSYLIIMTWLYIN